MLKRQNCCLTGEKRIALFIKPSKLKQLRNNSFYLGITGVVLFIGNVGHQRWFIVGEALVVLHPRYVKCRHNVFSLPENFLRAREFQHKIAR